MIKERNSWKDHPYYVEKFVSLYVFLGHAAGSVLGKEVYQEAARQKIPFGEKHVKNSRYEGRILCYPIPFLEKYFGQPIHPEKINKWDEHYDIDQLTFIDA